MALTAVQRQALQSGCEGRVHAPATGAYRRRGGEVDNVVCFNGRTLKALVQRGLLAESNGGYLTTDAGRQAVVAGKKRDGS